MTSDRDELRAAASDLDDLRDEVDDELADRLDGVADQLRSLADADRGPDHGRLDRLMHSLREIEGELGESESETVSSALGHVRSYRETVEGV